MSGEVVIRREEPGDEAGIARVNEQAFGQPVEACLVDALREAGAVTLSLVAVERGEIVGHILFSPVSVESTGKGGDYEAQGLAPMGVLPGSQRRGIGSRLVRAGLDELRRAGHEAVVVLGHPEFYPRFGFVRASTRGMCWEQEAPDEAFMVVELRPGALEGRGGVVRFRPEFADAV